MVEFCWKIIPWDDKSLKPNRVIYNLAEETYCYVGIWCYIGISNSPLIFRSGTPLDSYSLQFRIFHVSIVSTSSKKME